MKVSEFISYLSQFPSDYEVGFHWSLADWSEEKHYYPGTYVNNAKKYILLDNPADGLENYGTAIYSNDTPRLH